MIKTIWQVLQCEFVNKTLPRNGRPGSIWKLCGNNWELNPVSQRCGAGVGDHLVVRRTRLRACCGFLVGVWFTRYLSYTVHDFECDLEPHNSKRMYWPALTEVHIQTVPWADCTVSCAQIWLWKSVVHRRTRNGRNADPFCCWSTVSYVHINLRALVSEDGNDLSKQTGSNGQLRLRTYCINPRYTIWHGRVNIKWMKMFNCFFTISNAERFYHDGKKWSAAKRSCPRWSHDDSGQDPQLPDASSADFAAVYDGPGLKRSQNKQNNQNNTNHVQKISKDQNAGELLMESLYSFCLNVYFMLLICWSLLFGLLGHRQAQRFSFNIMTCFRQMAHRQSLQHSHHSTVTISAATDAHLRCGDGLWQHMLWSLWRSHQFTNSFSSCFPANWRNPKISESVLERLCFFLCRFVKLHWGIGPKANACLILHLEPGH